MQTHFDLFIIGGGINGAGIARDACGRGLRVGLCEQADFGMATSGASSKLIHGGLRYLEHFEFKLVAHALAERERLLKIAPHIAWPLRFKLPHEAHLRPQWMLQAGLFLYDHLHLVYGVQRSLAASKKVSLGLPLQEHFKFGFEYSDAWVDDARLTVLNVMDAKNRGATVYDRTQCTAVMFDGAFWNVTLKQSEQTVHIKSKCIVNAAGPWVKEMANLNGQPSRDQVQLVKGSHIVVPRVYEGDHAYILQQPDQRIIFIIPYEHAFTLIGTTDVKVGIQSLGYDLKPSVDEENYLIQAANRYLSKTIQASDIVHRYAGIRPLYDDGSNNPSQTTRDYVLTYKHQWLNVFGGKITTYRLLAQEALNLLKADLRFTSKDWTESACLPGGDIGNFKVFFQDLSHEYQHLPNDWLRLAAHRHGSNIYTWLKKTNRLENLGQHLGGGLYEAEADYLKHYEWAHTLDDMMWRRTKCGLHAAYAKRS